jgi:hypothetical protein
LDQDIEDVPVLIHRPPQIVTLTLDGQTHFIEVPLVPRSWTTATELIRILLPEFATYMDRSRLQGGE